MKCFSLLVLIFSGLLFAFPAFSQRAEPFSVDSIKMLKLYRALPDTIANWRTTDTARFDSRTVINYYRADGTKAMSKGFHSNGSLWFVYKCDEMGRESGTYLDWYPNGLMSMTREYVRDSIDSIGYTWNDTGLVKSVSTYTMGKGLVRNLYPSGKVKVLQTTGYYGVIYKEEGFCEDGFRVSVRYYVDRGTDPYIIYYCSGDTMLVTATNTQGFFIGPFVRKYQNGNIEEQGTYKTHDDDGDMDVKIGKWHYYNEEGALTKTEEYDGNGKLLSSSQPK